LAPNRKKLLANRNNDQTRTGDLWIYDLQRKNWERFSLESTTSEYASACSPDGETIVYAGFVRGNYKMYRRLADRSRETELLLQSNLVLEPTDWSPDGHFLLYTQSEVGVTGDLWVLPMEGDRKPFPLTQTGFDEGDGHFSPDGHWLAYIR
jgi:Tol biopolymer transport system component